MKNISFKKISLAFLTVVFLLSPSLTLAANISVSPLIIDVEAKANDVFNETVKISNNHTNPARVFASVNEISVGDNNEIKSFVPASMSDRTVSVTSWIEITRGRIDIAPGEEKDIPLLIRVNPNTPAGLYHAFVGFAVGTNRDIAEQTILDGQGDGVVVRILVGTKQQEFLRLVSYSTDPFSLSPDKGKIRFSLENIGDLPLTPKATVIIYDSRGRELTSVDIAGVSAEVILPGETKDFVDKLPYLNRVGKNKAYLTVDYGVERKAALYDTTFYYSIPWLYLVVIMILLLIVLLSIIVLVRRSGAATMSAYEPHEAQDLPFFVGSNRKHSEYEHDINLKNKDN
jgi:hypothetical protein